MKRGLVIHPFLFAVAPILFLYSQNVDGFPLNIIYMPIVFALSLVVVCWVLLGLILRDRTKSAILVSLGIFAFVSFGYIYNSLCALFTDGYPSPTLQKILLLVWPILFLIVAFFCLRARRNQLRLKRFLNVAGLSLVIVPLTGIIAYHIGTRAPAVRQGIGEAEDFSIRIGDDAVLPDIYYIVLDGCARSDVLAELYDYDNRSFLGQLRRRGFYVAPWSCANYCQTVLSFASSLNFRYLDGVIDGFDRSSTNRAPVRRMIMGNQVIRALRSYGYRSIAFGTGYYPAELRTADVFIQPVRNVWHLDEFQNGLLNMTAFPTAIRVLERLPEIGNFLADVQYEAHRRLVLHSFESLAHLPATSAPRFVFAHIIAPHPPFVFDRHGERVELGGLARQFDMADGDHLHYFHRSLRNQYVVQYREQLMFTEKKLTIALDSIFAKSAVPPIIIVQADHGPGSGLRWEDAQGTDVKERLAILNAFYLPGGGDTLLYDGISPVNTFRIIFNHYFGEQYELLEDKSYFSRLSRPYDFVDVTDRIRAAEAGREESYMLR